MTQVVNSFSSQPDSNGTSIHLDRILETQSSLADNLIRLLAEKLESQKIATVQDIRNMARVRGNLKPIDFAVNGSDPNELREIPWTRTETQVFTTIVKELSSTHFTTNEIDTVARDLEVRSSQLALEVMASRRPTFNELRRMLSSANANLNSTDNEATRVAVCRAFISEHPGFLEAVAPRIPLSRLLDIVNRTISPPDRQGWIGGKACGMIAALEILQQELGLGFDPKKDLLPLAVPKSWYLSTAAQVAFFEQHQLHDFEIAKFQPTYDAQHEIYTRAKSYFPTLELPESIIPGLRKILEEVGKNPLIVRSSSLLEDWSAPFSGIYESVFLPNQGSFDERLLSLCTAIRQVYASALNPDAFKYRKDHSLKNVDEQMAVLIQQVVGKRYGKYFFPVFAGVAYSWNDTPWSTTIRPEDGLVSLVMGLGTYAVDEGDNGYARRIPLGKPTVRNESSDIEIRKVAQRKLDVLNLDTCRFEKTSLGTILEQSDNPPILPLLVQDYKDSILGNLSLSSTPTRRLEDLCITFKGLSNSSHFPSQLQRILATLERELGFPVDVELASDGDKLYFVQCRRMEGWGVSDKVSIPYHINQDRVLFHTHKHIYKCLARPGIMYAVFVDPETYSLLNSDNRYAVRDIIKKINEFLPEKSFLLLGPGRWGSSNVLLGVPVTFAQIDNCAGLIELGIERLNFCSQSASRGTHFSNQLADPKKQIPCIPLDLDDPKTFFNRDMISKTPNSLLTIVPKARELAKVIHVLNLGQVELRMDGSTNQAIAYSVPYPMPEKLR